jgi:hypothetical protein
MKTRLPILLLATLSTFSLAQECESKSKPVTDLTDLRNGTVSQPALNLQWMKCNLGESWNGVSCQGDAQTLDFVQASKLSRSFEQYGYSDWRLPTREELFSLIDGNCRLPAINMTLFPTTKNAQYWSDERYSFFAHVVNFDHGYTFSTQMNNPKFIRLVRSN